MFALLVPLLAQALSVGVGDRTEARVRSTDGQGSVDLVTQATGGMRFTSPRYRWELTYAPTLTQLSLAQSSTSQLVVHNGMLAEQLRLSPRTTAFFAETATYGLQNFRVQSVSSPGSLGAGVSSNPSDATASGTPTTQPTPGSQSGTSSLGVVDQTTRYVALSVSGSLSHQFSRRWRGDISTGYAMSEGVDSASRIRFPQLKQLYGESSAYFAATQRDSLNLTARAERADMPSIMSAYGETLELGWSRRLSAFTRTRLTAGEAFIVWDNANGDKRRILLPVGSAGLTFAGRIGRGRSMQVSALERVAPVIDRFRGTVYPQATSTLTVSATFDKLMPYASAFAAITGGSVPRTSRYSYGAILSLAYRLSKSFVVEAGVRQSVFWLTDGSPTTSSWVAYLAATFSTGDVRL
jgi:hypothetical protein